MVFQANKWGWKALAARMLLAPVLAGSLAAPAFAQSGAKSQPAAAASAGDPKEMLKQGRKALADGRFDEAMQMASAAAAGNTSGRWGLFGDSPDALVKDTVAARTKADKAAAEVLVKEAKALYSKSAKSDTDRIANLDVAAAKIDQAVTLSGRSDWLDDLNPFADKPESLKREIDAARAAYRRANPVARADARATTPLSSGVRQASATTAPNATKRQPKFELEQPIKGATDSNSAEKAKAVACLKEGRGLMASGKLAEARAKFTEAAKTGATFSLTEDNPDKCLQEVAEKGKLKVDGLVAEAQRSTTAKDHAKAEAALVSARELAGSLDLWTRGIDLELDAVKNLSGNKLVSADVPTLPGLPVPSDAPKAIDLPKPAAPLPDIPSLDLPKIAEEAKVAGPPKPAVDPKIEAGRKMLDQATAEMKRGELEMARKLAVEVHNGGFGLKDDAQKLMVAIDAEMKVAKASEATKSLDAAKQAMSAKQYEYADKLLSLIDSTVLPEDKKKQYDAMVEMAGKEVAKLKAPTG
ncbi:MAG TPA: hypothetical protein VM597_03720, partial [Gemmataceae bacterium]|nr:hypothetical protein [Gemmataceae bacterium]